MSAKSIRACTFPQSIRSPMPAYLRTVVSQKCTSQLQNIVENSTARRIVDRLSAFPLS